MAVGFAKEKASVAETVRVGECCFSCKHRGARIEHYILCSYDKRQHHELLVCKHYRLTEDGFVKGKCTVILNTEKRYGEG